MRTGFPATALVLFLVLSPALSSAQGEASTDEKNALSLEVVLPLAVPIGILGPDRDLLIPVVLQYQRVIADHLVLVAMIGLYYDQKLPPQPRDSTLSIFPVVELDWHPFHEGLRGFHLGLSGVFACETSFSDAKPTEVTSRYYRLGLGPTVGWQFMLPAHIIIDLVFGLGYGPSWNVDAAGTSTFDWALDPTRAGIYLGLMF